MALLMAAMIDCKLTIRPSIAWGLVVLIRLFIALSNAMVTNPMPKRAIMSRPV